MINEFLELLQTEGLQEEYVEKVNAHRANPSMWMDSVEPYQYVYDAFPGGNRGKWGTLHIKWYRIVKEAEGEMSEL